MDYRAKMIQHLEEAEVLDARVDHWEQWAEQKILKEEAEELKKYQAGDARDEVKLYFVQKLLQGRRVYLNLVKRRDLHMKKARMYGIAAIASFDTRSGDFIPGHLDPRVRYGNETT